MRNQGFSYLKRIVRVVAISYLGLVFLLYFFQERFIFFPKVLPADYKFQFAGDFQEKILTVGGAEVHSLLFRVPAPKAVILYFHGNAGAMDSWGDVAAELSQKTGCNVWMMDYPGFGKSSGSIRSQQQLLDMAQAFVNEVRREFPSLRLFIYGRSVGSGVAVKTAADNNVDGLILETPYTSLYEMAKLRFSWFPQILLKYSMPSNQWIRNVESPIVIVHGDQDQVIPAEMGYKLSRFSNRSSYVLIPGGDHNNLSEFESYWDAVNSLLR
ncbi:alpha/beta hydrolase [Bdellovibrio bacteriovorus]|uniref:alpha/beta hydrolase n=1 Tax=Bdellovibrio bacteriovorus TaxID=959 RepID=UPI003AA8115C